MDTPEVGQTQLSPRAKLIIVAIFALVAIFFLLQIRVILFPFLWALVVAYLLSPVVNYLNIEGRLPRLWCVFLIYVSFGLLLVAASRYLYPKVVEQANLFLEDIPRIQASIENVTGPRPFGIDINGLVQQLVAAGQDLTGNQRSAGHLLVNAVETLVKVFLFLVATFYLLLDAPRLRHVTVRALPPGYRDELYALGRQIHVTWQQYIRGELLLFALMATATSIALTILQVPGSLFIGIATGALELLPLVGPLTAGAIAVSVAYFDPSVPWGLSQGAYAAIVAILYFVLRHVEDYFVIPNVLGRAVRLNRLVILFSLAAGGVFLGIFGLIIAVPVAASIKEIWNYVYCKLLDQPVEFQPIRTLSGAVIEIPVGKVNTSPEGTAQEGTSAG